MASRRFFNDASASSRFRSFRSFFSVAFDGKSTYRGGVSIIRILALVLFGLGLFVQAAAQAAAVPQVEAAEIVHCSEMSDAMMEKMAHDGSSEEQPCDQMTLDCVVPMGCLAPATVPDADSVSLTAPPTDRDTDRVGDLAGLKGGLLAPESPPPQADLDI